MLPPITGRISTPEDPDTTFPFSAFRHVDDKGRPYWIGPVDINRSVRQALSTTPKQGHNFVAIRENGFKVFATLAEGTANAAYTALTPIEQAHEDKKPSFWLTWTRDPEKDPVLHGHLWEREPNRYGRWASGSTQHHRTKDELAAMLQNADPQPEQEVEARPARARSSRSR